MWYVQYWNVQCLLFLYRKKMTFSTLYLWRPELILTCPAVLHIHISIFQKSWHASLGLLVSRTRRPDNLPYQIIFKMQKVWCIKYMRSEEKAYTSMADCRIRRKSMCHWFTITDGRPLALYSSINSLESRGCSSSSDKSRSLRRSFRQPQCPGSKEFFLSVFITSFFTFFRVGNE